jgi:hypothetical protein
VWQCPFSRPKAYQEMVSRIVFNSSARNRTGKRRGSRDRVSCLCAFFLLVCETFLSDGESGCSLVTGVECPPCFSSYHFRTHENQGGSSPSSLQPLSSGQIGVPHNKSVLCLLTEHAASP